MRAAVPGRVGSWVGLSNAEPMLSHGGEMMGSAGLRLELHNGDFGKWRRRCLLKSYKNHCGVAA